MHSESIDDQNRAVKVAELILNKNSGNEAMLGSYKSCHTFCIKHQVIIQQFGRFPHRNEILGRESTPEEDEYLKNGGERFGS